MDVAPKRSSAAGRGLAHPSVYSILEVVAFAVIPAVVFAALFLDARLASGGDFGFDFRQFWQGAHDVVHGHTPYPSRELLETSSSKLGGAGIQHVFRFPYPAATAVLLAPLGALPFHLALGIEVVLLCAAVVAALRLLGVVDWRVYGIVTATVVANGAIRLGTLTPALVLLLAVAWRWRDRRWVVAPALAVAIVAKLFLWPLVVWLVATRRFASAATSVALTAGIVVAGWGVIGFEGMTLYPELVRRLSDVVGGRGYSLAALATHAGVPGVSGALPYLVGLPVLAACLVLGRMRRGGDEAAFAVALLASLLLTPIVWLHYFLLLAVPIAIVRTRVSWPWLLLLLFWLTPSQENDGHLWQIVVALALTAAITALCAAEGPRSATARAAESLG